MTEKNEGFPEVVVTAMGGPYDGQHSWPTDRIKNEISDEDDYETKDFAETVYEMVCHAGLNKFKGKSPAGINSLLQNPGSTSQWYCYEVIENKVGEDGKVYITVQHISEQ